MALPQKRTRMVALSPGIHGFRVDQDRHLPSSPVGDLGPVMAQRIVGIGERGGNLRCVSRRRSDQRLRWSGVAGVGDASLEWDGRNDGGWKVPAGVYLVRVSAPAAEARRRMVLARWCTKPPEIEAPRGAMFLAGN